MAIEEKIRSHPSILFEQDLKEICSPLNKLNITYFAHVHIDKDGRFSALTNHAEYTKLYLEKKYYNADIHLANTGLIKNHFVWDSIDIQGVSAEMIEDANRFNLYHTFTIMEDDCTGRNYYHFETNQFNKSINQVYLSNIDLLKLFILYFKDKVRGDKRLSSAYSLTFQLDEESKGFWVDNKLEGNSQLAREDFLGALNTDGILNICGRKIISVREMEVLSWLHAGKTTADIARILGLADVTIHKHIASIKAKTQCYTQFQLGEFFASNYDDFKEIFQFIQK